MNDKSETKKPSRHKKLLKFLIIKFPIILLVLGCVLYFSLKMAERYPVPLREGMEEYISGLSGTYASIGKLEKFAFVPKIDVDFREITLHRKSNAAEIDLSAEHVKIVIPFWSAFLGQNRFRELLIENVDSKEGVFLPKAFMFDRIEIVDREGPEQFGSFLVAKGSYNNKPLDFEAKLNKKGEDYILFKSTPFSIILGKSSLTGSLTRNLTTVDLEQTIFKIDEKTSEAADYVLVKSREYIKSNPLACLVIEGDGEKCIEYLNSENNSQ